MISNISMNRIILHLITISALVACTTGPPPQTPTAVPTPTAEPAADTIPNTYHGVTLPRGVGTVTQDAPPLVWLIVGDKAVIGTLAAGGTSRGHGDPAYALPDLPAASLPADARAVIVVGSESFKSFKATVRPWSEDGRIVPLYDNAARELKAEVQREGSLTVFTLEPTGDASDQLLNVNITFSVDDAWGFYLWRLNPAPIAIPTPVSPGVQIEPVVTAGMIRFHSWSPDGETLAYWEFTPEEAAVSYTYPPGSLEFLNARTGQTCPSPYAVGYGYFSDSIAWLPDGRILIVTGGEVIIGTPCGDDFATLTIFPAPITSIAVPNNEFLAAMGLVFGSGDHQEALFVVQAP